jgi:hypothetical protein
MIGTLYRYPHPYDPSRFIYVGQGPKRDEAHRSGRSTFGRGFKKLFPGVELPQPVREQVEVSDYIQLNEEETIWMFKYHTWRGYDGGMNLTVPGSTDYKNLGKIAGHIASKTGQIQALAARNHTPEHQAAAGRKAGLKPCSVNGKNHMARVGRTGAGGRKGGPIGGRKTALIPGHMARAGSIGGRTGASLHLRWHVKRNSSSPRCVLCSEQNLVITFA